MFIFFKFHNARLPGSLNNLFVQVIWCGARFMKKSNKYWKKEIISFGFALSFDNQFLIEKKIDSSQATDRRP